MFDLTLVGKHGNTLFIQTLVEEQKELGKNTVKSHKNT